jgi:hypothetical protein
MGDNRRRFVTGEERIMLLEDFKCEWKTFFVCDLMRLL